jgi:hypothetical protein
MAAITARFLITRVAAVVLRVVEARESYWMFSTQRLGLGLISCCFTIHIWYNMSLLEKVHSLGVCYYTQFLESGGRVSD